MQLLRRFINWPLCYIAVKIVFMEWLERGNTKDVFDESKSLNHKVPSLLLCYGVTKKKIKLIGCTASWYS